MTIRTPSLETLPTKVKAVRMKPAQGSGLFTEEAAARVTAAFTKAVSRAIDENAKVVSKPKQRPAH